MAGATSASPFSVLVGGEKAAAMAVSAFFWLSVSGEVMVSSPVPPCPLPLHFFVGSCLNCLGCSLSLNEGCWVTEFGCGLKCL